MIESQKNCDQKVGSAKKQAGLNAEKHCIPCDVARRIGPYHAYHDHRANDEN